MRPSGSPWETRLSVRRARDGSLLSHTRWPGATRPRSGPGWPKPSTQPLPRRSTRKMGPPGSCLSSGVPASKTTPMPGRGSTAAGSVSPERGEDTCPLGASGRSSPRPSPPVHGRSSGVTSTSLPDTERTRPRYRPRCLGKRPSTSVWWSEPARKPLEKPRLYVRDMSARSLASRRSSGLPATTPSTQRRYPCTVVVTYCGPFRRPSIFRLWTPMSTSSGMARTPARSLGLSRYRTSPRSRVWPSTTRSYGRRHDWAHWPRLAERPPQASLVRHWPLHDMQRAPWMKTSSSMSVCPASRRISVTESSRGTTTRVTPRPRAKRMPSALEMVICVEACSSSWGQRARASRAMAGSWMMRASTPDSATRRRMRSTTGSSGSKTSVLSVT